MKKLQNLKEWQIVGIFSALGVSVTYASVVALFAHTLDLLPVMTVCALLVAVTAVAVGVVVGMVKDAQLARVVRGYRALNSECSDSARIIGELRDTNRALVANLAHARERLADGGCDLVEHDDADAYADELREAHGETYSLVNLLRAVLDPSHDEHLTAMNDLNGFTAMGSQGMDDEGIIWYASAIWNGEGYSCDDLNRLDRMREIYEISEPVRTEKEYTETAYTCSASTALLFGTLDRAYEVNNETRYPLA